MMQSDVPHAYEAHIAMYCEGIARATGQGLIRVGNPIKDLHSHLPCIDGTNTRELHPCVRNVVALLRRQRSGVIDALECGSGAGRAVGELGEILPDGSTIHTVGLTPFNPYLRLTKGPSEIVDGIRKHLKQDRNALPPSLAADFEKARRHIWLDIGFVLATQQHYPELRAFIPVEKAVADLQHIDTFPLLQLQRSTYTLISEYHGPLAKTSFMPESMNVVRNALTDDGAIVVAPFDRPLRNGHVAERLQTIRSGIRSTDCLVYCITTDDGIGDDDTLVITPAGSPMAEWTKSHGEFDKATQTWNLQWET